MSLSDQMRNLARNAKAASRELARLSSTEKNACLQAMASALLEAEPQIQAANQLDLEFGRSSGLSGAMLDRLRLDSKRIQAMAHGLREVANLPDPVGITLDSRTRPKGLLLRKVSVPIGVIVIIYESRPNVTADAASLCFKSGNAVILRGGNEALNSNQIIAQTMVQAARQTLPSFPEHAIQVVPTPDRDAIRELLSQTDLVDLCMPRGGEGLIRAVVECSKVPVIKHYKGVCHVFVDRNADLEMATRIALNAKAQRPAVCNAMETLLVHSDIAQEFLRMASGPLASKNVEIRADPASLTILSSLAPANTPPALTIKAATDQDYYTEYNDFILNLRIVDSLNTAVDHIAQYGSAHSDSIITQDEATAKDFMARVDSAAVYWNASTRFTDGGEFGMGAEIGISTDKIGARGPMGLEELTSYKWLGFGTGQIRT